MEDFGLEGFFEELANQTGSFIEASDADGIYKYLKTIDWSEQWIITLIVFHFLVFLLTIFSRHCQRFQSVLFLIILSLIYFSEQINILAAKNWKMFSNEQYFDSNGLFITIMFSVPLILNSSLIVLFWLRETYVLLVKVARLKKAKKLKLNNESDKTSSDDKKQN